MLNASAVRHHAQPRAGYARAGEHDDANSTSVRSGRKHALPGDQGLERGIFKGLNPRDGTAEQLLTGGWCYPRQGKGPIGCLRGKGLV